MVIGPGTRLATLIGDPVGHSLSPAIHNAAYGIQGVDAVYLSMRVPIGQLRDAVVGLKAMGVMGINVTIPHKRSVVELLDEVRADAQAIGAVNTIVLKDDGNGSTRLIGENTDVGGFIAPLAALRESIRDKSAVILGAGGAARAVLYACHTSLRPSKVTVVARKPARAQQMIDALAQYSPEKMVSVLPFDDARGAVLEAKLIVNTTPVGTYPGVHATPWMHVDSFRPGQVVYDVVYNPVETRFLRDAQSRGATVLNGMEMLLAQASAAHTLWTGLRMPIDEVRETVLGQRRDQPI